MPDGGPLDPDDGISVTSHPSGRHVRHAAPDSPPPSASSAEGEAHMRETLRFYGRQQQYLDPIGHPCECVWCDTGRRARALLPDAERWPPTVRQALVFYATSTDETTMSICTRERPCVYCDGGRRARTALLELGETLKDVERLIDAEFFFGVDGLGHWTHSLMLRPTMPLAASVHVCPECGSEGVAGSLCSCREHEHGHLIHRHDRDEAARCGYCGSTGSTYSECVHEIDGVRYAVARLDANAAARCLTDDFDEIPGPHPTRYGDRS